MYIDPTGEFGIVGALFGGGLEVLLQLATNGWRIECIDWADVVISTAVGALSPSIIDSAKKLNRIRIIIDRNPGNAIGSRAARKFGDELMTQLGWQTAKAIGKGAFGDDKECGCDNDCGCK